MAAPSQPRTSRGTTCSPFSAPKACVPGSSPASSLFDPPPPIHACTCDIILMLMHRISDDTRVRYDIDKPSSDGYRSPGDRGRKISNSRESRSVRARTNEENSSNRIDSNRLFFMKRLEVSHDWSKYESPRRHLLIGAKEIDGKSIRSN